MLISLIKYFSFIYVLITLMIFIYKDLIFPIKTEAKRNKRIDKLSNTKYYLFSIPHLIINIICLIIASTYIHFKLYWYFIIIAFLVSIIKILILIFNPPNSILLKSLNRKSFPDLIITKKIAGIAYLFTFFLWIYSWSSALNKN